MSGTCKRTENDEYENKSIDKVKIQRISYFFVIFILVVTKTLYLVLFSLLVFSCTDPVTEPSEQKETSLDWFEGNYEYSTPEGLYREFWKKRNEQEYVGKGYFLHKGDTSFLMRMKLYRDKKLVKMDYNVRGQNHGKDVEFVLTKHENGLYVFENPFRDFPSIMQYKLLGDTAIKVTERGFEDNKDKTLEFTLLRMKEN